MAKEILMVAGPNGAGKTTMTLELIAGNTKLYEFINADEIAKGLAPLHPESVALSASKLMIQRFKDLVKEGKSFAFETTGAGTNYMKHLKEAQEQGYKVSLIYLWLAKPQQAVKRVAERVKQGGHDVPEKTIIRRYYAGIKNILNHYLPLADYAEILDNSSKKTTNKPIARKSNSEFLDILNENIWKKLEDSAREQ